MYYYDSEFKYVQTNAPKGSEYWQYIKRLNKAIILYNSWYGK